MNPSEACLSLESLQARCAQRIQESHQRSQKRGISFPEVNWEEIMGLPVPLILEHARLLRHCTISDEAASFLKSALLCGMRLGICSNGQAYTKVELREALIAKGLTLLNFQSELTFWSYEHGYAKPEPKAFKYLSDQAQRMGVKLQQILMIGDREDNDISPAKYAGWLTWHLISK